RGGASPEPEARASPRGGIWRKPEARYGYRETRTVYEAYWSVEPAWEGETCLHQEGQCVNTAGNHGRCSFLPGEVCSGVGCAEDVAAPTARGPRSPDLPWTVSHGVSSARDA